jgi:hypothetical protein
MNLLDIVAVASRSFSKNQGLVNAEEKIFNASKQHQVKAGHHMVESNPAQIPVLVEKVYDMMAFSVDIRMLDSSARLPFHSYLGI